MTKDIKINDIIIPNDKKERIVKEITPWGVKTIRLENTKTTYEAFFWNTFTKKTS